MSNALIPFRPLTPEVWQMLAAIGQAAYVSRKFGLAQGEGEIKSLFCWENNLPLSAANMGIYVYNGRIGLMGNIVAAKIRTSGRYDYKVKELNGKGCTIQILRQNKDGEMTIEGEASFTEQDAKQAGLNNKDNYKNWSEDMYFNRAIMRAYRRYAPDIFMQPVYTPEELGFRVSQETGEVIEGSWQVEQLEQKSDPLTDALNELLAQYTPELILAANDGNMPATLKEAENIKQFLAESEQAQNG